MKSSFICLTTSSWKMTNCPSQQWNSKSVFVWSYLPNKIVRRNPITRSYLFTNLSTSHGSSFSGVFALTLIVVVSGYPVKKLSPTPPIPFTNPTTTTRPKTTTHTGCYYEGKYYAPGSEISSGQSKASNWCWITRCDEQGHVLNMDNFNCFTTPPFTTTMGATPTTMPGCYYDGKYYPFGERFDEGRTGDWCYGSYCDFSGHVVMWDNWNCGGTTNAVTTVTTAPPVPTTLPPDVDIGPELSDNESDFSDHAPADFSTGSNSSKNIKWINIDMRVAYFKFFY